jgi:outer membrane immunogenic protein
MRNIAIVLGLTAITTSATAADMPLKAPPRAASVFSWTGCYIGGYIGGAWNGGNGATFTDQGQGDGRDSYSGGRGGSDALPRHSWSADLDSSVIGGGTLGCNWQPAGSSFVLGVEGEAGYMRLTGQAFDPNTIRNDIDVSTGQTTLDVLGSAKVGDWYGMVTGRLGYASDRTLLYVKGGAAFVPTRGAIVDACSTDGCGNWLVSTAGSRTVTTWTLGGGIEWAFAPSWSVKAEYMFIALGDNGGFRTCGSATNPSNNNSIVSGGSFCFDHSFDGIHTAKIGLNYRFGGGRY